MTAKARRSRLRSQNNYLIQSSLAILIMEEFENDMRKAGYLNIAGEWEMRAAPSLVTRIRRWFGGK